LKQRIGFWLGLGLFALILAAPTLEPGRPQVSRMAASAALVATWWITEALPIPATSLLPLVLFPVLGILPGSDTATSYMNSTVFLIIGGFLIALSIEKCGLHRRLALFVIRVLGTRPRMIILGFMIATAALSMWISNTATTLLMLPIALSVAGQIEPDWRDPAMGRRFDAALLLSVAYSASVGGLGTLIGTIPNVVFARIFAITFPQAPPITFSQWLGMGIPLVCIFIPLIWLVMTFALFPLGGPPLSRSREVLDEARGKLGPMGADEKRVLTVFVLTALLWTTRSSIRAWGATLPGWSDLLGLSGVDDATVAIFGGLLLFALPSETPGERLLDWETALKIPWGVVILFGGGFAVATGFKEAALDAWIAGRSRPLGGCPVPVQVLAVSSMVTFLTEITSNTATTQMFWPPSPVESTRTRFCSCSRRRSPPPARSCCR
jgi:sodium-dependent dicarboxylate transporter 2/3/5